MNNRELNRLFVAMCVGMAIGILFTLWATFAVTVGVFDGFQCRRYSPIDGSCVLFERQE